MYSQLLGILLIFVIFICGTLIAVLLEKRKSKEREPKNNLGTALETLESGGERNLMDEKSVTKKTIESPISQRHLPRLYQFNHRVETNEIDKIKSRDEVNFVFLDTETSSLNDPHIIDMCLMNVSGEVILSSKVRYEGVISEKAKEAHQIQSANESYHPSPASIENELIDILKGKTIIAYNAEFDLRAIKTTFTSDKMVSLIHELESNTICIMKAFQELFRFHKRQTLVRACEHLGIEKLPAHDAGNDTLMLYMLYQKTKPLFPLAQDWMLGFEDIHWENLNLLDETELSYWSSRDKERQALYRPGSVMGSGKVAELNDKLKSDLENFGEVSFVISKKHGVPEVVMSTISHKEAKENHELYIQQSRDEYINQLLNPIMPAKDKLRLNLTLDCREANRERIPPLAENETYKPYVKEGDVLTIPRLLFTPSFNFKDVQFIDVTGQSCGHLSNANKSWTRVFGILMKGYRAEVHIIEASKRLKVDVCFIEADS